MVGLLEEFDLLFSGCVMMDGGGMSRVLGCLIYIKVVFFFFEDKQKD